MHVDNENEYLGSLGLATCAHHTAARSPLRRDSRNQNKRDRCRVYPACTEFSHVVRTGTGDSARSGDLLLDVRTSEQLWMASEFPKRPLLRVRDIPVPRNLFSNE